MAYSCSGRSIEKKNASVRFSRVFTSLSFRLKYSPQHAPTPFDIVCNFKDQHQLSDQQSILSGLHDTLRHDLSKFEIMKISTFIAFVILSVTVYSAALPVPAPVAAPASEPQQWTPGKPIWNRDAEAAPAPNPQRWKPGKPIWGRDAGAVPVAKKWSPGKPIWDRDAEAAPAPSPQRGGPIWDAKVGAVKEDQE